MGVEAERLPKVLLTLRRPALVSMDWIVRRPARPIALRLDDPDAFLAEPP
jgi:hypothetical protein